MLANAVRVCGANFGIMDRYDGGAFCNVAMHNVPPAFAEMRRSNPVIRPSPGTGLDRVQRTKKVVQILDLKSEQAYRDHAPARVALVKLAGARTLLVVPMLKDDVLVGRIAIYRRKYAPSPISKSSWSRIAAQASSQSRTRGCSTNYADHSSSRLRPLTCSRSLSKTPRELSSSRNHPGEWGALVRGQHWHDLSPEWHMVCTLATA